eukprot:8286709-Karenia_brevis.AAC.1
MALLSGRFNFLACTTKRKEATQTSGCAAKLLKASDISVEQSPRPIRFNFLASDTKRKASTQTSGRAAKLPKASDIPVEQVPRPVQTPRRLPASAPVDVCVVKYTDQASDLWELFQSKDDVPLYQIQIQHLAQRAVTFQMRDSFNDFLRTTHAADNAMPATLQQLESAAGVRLVVTDRADPDDVGYVQWR